jgi:hypothetical protein
MATAPPERPRLRTRIKQKPGIKHAWRVGVFVLGLLFIVLGIALATLPGPLTIPPVLFGLWIWSTEFAFAERFFDQFKEKGREAWEHARAHPKSSAAVTVGGLIAAGAAVYFAQHYGLFDKAKNAIL